MTAVYQAPAINEVHSRRRRPGVDPVSFMYTGLTDEEKNWTVIQADGPKANMFSICQWLMDHGITEWCWTDRAPDRMVNRNNIYFKYERDAMWFKLGWS